jgi:hypothetical protein
MNGILIRQGCYQIFKVFHSFKRFIAYLYVPIRNVTYLFANVVTDLRKTYISTRAFITGVYAKSFVTDTCTRTRTTLTIVRISNLTSTSPFCYKYEVTKFAAKK